MRKFQVGDKVRIIPSKIDTYRSQFIDGKTYEVFKAENAVDPINGQLLTIKGERGMTSLFSYRVQPVNEVDIHICGSVAGRGNGVVSVKTEHGIVVLPEALAPAPVDPDLLELRELVATYTENRGARFGAKEIRDGNRDRKLPLARYKELKNVQGR